MILEIQNGKYNNYLIQQNNQEKKMNKLYKTF